MFQFGHFPLMKLITIIDMGITQTDQYELDLAKRWMIHDKIMKLIVIINMDLNQTDHQSH